ncbi:hypothetical protein D9758_006706 [Tetrapyrgos nigripes]|uniref:Uncharacterized protein n=1 Tax=Tetrapyrgos nigripes TaxID=182062 RepID=A0A8H5GJ89_9AGAR|nr:hypothetical protein D9758_006706 [Tetrapyrgos nigripes]
MSFNDMLFLTFSPNTSFGGTRPVERDIDRKRLGEISPDRSDLFESRLSIQELRHVLKINNILVNGEWLNLHKLHQEVRIRKTTIRTSAFFRDAREQRREQREEAERGMNEKNNRGSLSLAGHTHSRRLSSGSSFNPLDGMTSIENRLFTNVGNKLESEGIPPPRLTTTSKMFSPRPLGPTHVLVVVNASQDGAKQRDRGGCTVTYPSCLELPINDLLFILGCPNLNERIGHATTQCSPLPRRLTDELPRVGICVPNLATFPELVVFLHTYNQAELLRRIVPEWVRDMVHPLNTSGIGYTTGSESQSQTTGSWAKPTPRRSISSIASDDSASSTNRSKNWFSVLLGRSSNSNSASGSVSARSSASSVSASSLRGSVSGSFGTLNSLIDLNTVGSPQATRTLDAVARDIAYSANRAAIADTNRESIDLVGIQMSLNALRDNLDFVGYFESSLWNELDIYKDVLVRAIAFQSQFRD